MLLGMISCSETVMPETPSLSGGVSSPVPEVYFGMHIHRAGSGTAWPPVGVGSWRLWDAGIGWPEEQPERGKWQFGLLDKYLAMAQLTGSDILLPLGRTPRWASSRPFEKSAYGTGQAAEPIDIEDWRNYVRAVARRYRGRIRAYEIWNEPNEKGFFSGTPEALLRLQSEAYRILKEIDPNNLVVMPAAVHALQWLDDYLALGGGRYADIIGYHFYVPKHAPEAIPGEVAKVRALMAKHGVGDKPLWNTETGWWIANSDGTPEDAGVSPTWKRLAPDEAAAFVARALILGRWAGLDRFYWYAWDNRGLGLIEPQTGKLKPAALAYGVVRGWLQGRRLTGCQRIAGAWQCQLEAGDKSESWRIVWSPDGVSTWTVPEGMRVASVEGLDGGTKIIESPHRLEIGTAPVRVSLKPLPVSQ